MGIGGTAMGNAAILCKQQGYHVTGADTAVYPPMSDRLREEDIFYRDGYSAEILEKENPDVVIVGNALSRGNPEIEWLLAKRKIPFTSLAQFLSEEILQRRHSMVVSGTHGKTTTSTLLAYLLTQHLQKSPGFLIGGVPLNLPGGSQWGDDDTPFVIEGDEYDTAFFDKRSKFIHYAPKTLLINNIEFDHGDIFRDLEDILRTFSHLLRIVPEDGVLIVNGDDENIRTLLPVPWTKHISVGLSENCFIRITEFEDNEQGSSFTLLYNGKTWGKVTWSLHGIFNARNAAMALTAAAHYLFPQEPMKFATDCLQNFSGVKRRQEKRFQNETFTVIEDFGHHPTAIGQTIESLRSQYPHHRIAVCFEPRSNTAVTNRLQDEFQDALSKADEILLPPIHRLERIAPEKRFQTSKVVEAIVQMGKAAHAFASFAELQDHLEATYPPREKTVLCFFSNGSFDGLLGKLSFLQKKD